MGLKGIRECLIFGGPVSPPAPIREHLPNGHESEPTQEALSGPWRDPFEAVTDMHWLQPQALVHPAEDVTRCCGHRTGSPKLAKQNRVSPTLKSP